MGLLATHHTTDRVALRRSIGLPGTVRSNGIPYDVNVRDLSASGFSASIPVALAVGEIVSLGLPSLGVVEATVTRSEGETHGFSFVRHLTIDTVQRVERIDTVHAGAFTPVWDGAPTSPDPVIKKWPGAVRVAVLVVGALTSWATLGSAIWVLHDIL